ELRGTRARPGEVPDRPDRLPLAGARRLEDGLRVPEGAPPGRRRRGAGEVRAAERLRHAVQLDPRQPRRDRRGRAARPRRGRVVDVRAEVSGRAVRPREGLSLTPAAPIPFDVAVGIWVLLELRIRLRSSLN